MPGYTDLLVFYFMPLTIMVASMAFIEAFMQATEITSFSLVAPYTGHHKGFTYTVKNEELW